MPDDTIIDFNADNRNDANDDGLTTVGEFLDEMPEPSEFVIDKAQANADAIKNNPVVDSDGTIFDDAMHMTNNDGPLLTIKGKFRKKPGRKKSTPDSLKSQLSAPEVTETVDSEMAAKMAAELLVTLGMQIGGDEWKPVINEEYGLDEMANLKYSFKTYFDDRGIVDFPPGIALIIAVGSYALPRFRLPKTKSRLAVVGSWIKEKYAKITGKI